MVLLPMVERELRVAARKAKSYWHRLLTAGLALGLFGATLALAQSGWRWSNPEVFQLLGWYAFVYCLFAGALATADCLSEERRENTLGLLFLTDLKGYDVVLGKLFANSVGCAFSLLAILPILAIPIMMGGVQFAEFWRIALNLFSTLILSLSCGLFVSLWCSNGFRATGTAILLMALIGFALPILLAVMRHYAFWPEASEILSLFSPFNAQIVAFSSARWFRSNPFWFSVVAIQGLALLLLLAACLLLPRIWQERAPGERRFLLAWPRHWREWNRGRGTRRSRSLRLLLERNPFAWLAGRQRLGGWGFLLVLALLVVFVGWLTRYFRLSGRPRFFEEQLVAWIWAGVVLHCAVLTRISSFACQRLGEDRQCGTLEPVLCTPLSIGTILRGIWHALGRRLLGPILIVALVHGVVIFQVLIVLGQDGNRSRDPWEMLLSMLRGLFSRHLDSRWYEGFILGSLLAAALGAVAHWIALGWVGMWLGLRLRHPRFAPWLALGLVIVPPWILFSAGIIALLEFASVWSDSRWFYLTLKLLLFCHLLPDAVLSFWACHQLRHRFRTVVTDRFRATEVSWGSLRRIVLRWGGAMLAIAFGLGLFHLEENWRGRRAWQQLRQELAGRGETLDLKTHSPPLVPAPRNFAAAAVVKPMFEFPQPPRILKPPASVPGPVRLTLRQVSLHLDGQSRGLVTWAWNQGWPNQRFTDLDYWRKEYQAKGFVSSNSAPGSAAEDILKALRKFGPVLEQVRAASERPESRFPISYEGRWDTGLPHHEVLCNVSEVLRYRASAELVLGQVEEAFQDARLCLYLAESVRVEPFRQSQSLRAELLAAAVQPIWEGLAQGCWEEHHLLWFQDRLAAFNLLRNHPTAMRAEVCVQMEHWTNKRSERAMRKGFWRFTRLFYPEGWTYQNQVNMYRFGEKNLLGLVDPARKIAYPAEMTALAMEEEAITFFPHRSLGQFWDAVQKSARAQTVLDQASVACALERHWRHHQAYPESLELLSPEYLAGVPHDIIDGGPLQYRAMLGRQYVLYSVGWNQQDDGGIGLNEADWAWKYPAP